MVQGAKYEMSLLRILEKQIDRKRIVSRSWQEIACFTYVIPTVTEQERL